MAYFVIAHVGFLIKNDGLPAALRERKSPTNASETVRSAGPGAALTKRPVGLAIKIRFGRGLWKSLHRMTDAWPCARCRPQMTVWMQRPDTAPTGLRAKSPFARARWPRHHSAPL